MSFTIEELAMPDSLDGSGAAEYLAYVAVGNAVEADVVGTDLLTLTPDELLPEYRDNPTRRRAHATASVGGVAVGRAMVTTRPHAPGAGAYLVVDVLPEHRGQGIGSALNDWAEAAASAEGESVLKVSIAHTVSTSTDRIASPTGFGDVPAHDPGVRFLLRRRYSLEQVVRTSVLDSAGLADRLPALLGGAQEKAGDAYSLISWTGPTPTEWLDDLAVLRGRMSTDAPMGGLQAPPDPWDAARVEAHDERMGEGGMTMLTTAVEHVGSGRLAGFSEIAVPLGRAAAIQEDTLVLREHRGHRLGMLLKAATAQTLLREAPHVEAVVTWNAEENRPMLEVNEAMGFRPIGYEGGWLRRG